MQDDRRGTERMTESLKSAGVAVDEAKVERVLEALSFASLGVFEESLHSRNLKNRKWSRHDRDW